MKTREPTVESHLRHAARYAERAEVKEAIAAKLKPRVKALEAKLRPLKREYAKLKRTYETAAYGAIHDRREARWSKGRARTLAERKKAEAKAARAAILGNGIDPGGLRLS